MYIHYCPAYEAIEVKVETMSDHINLNINSKSSGSSLSITLNGTQVSVVASALIEILTTIGEVEDRFGIFGGAVRIGTQKEAA